MMDCDSQAERILAPHRHDCIEFKVACGSTWINACLLNSPFQGLSGPQVYITVAVGHMHDPPDCLGLAEFVARIMRVKLNRLTKTDIDFEVTDDKTVFSCTSLPPLLGDVSEVLTCLIVSILSPVFEPAIFTHLLETDEFKQSISALNWLQRCSGDRIHSFNRQTLPGQRTVKSFEFSGLHLRVKEFYRKYYCEGNRILLALEDYLGINELKELIHQAANEVLRTATSYYIVGAPAPQMYFKKHPLDDSYNAAGGTKIRGESMNLGGIFLVFPLPDQTELHQHSPDLLVRHMFDRKGPGSLRSCLSQRGVVLDSACLAGTGRLGFDTFCIAAHCDKAPYSEETENMVITAVFRYLAMIRSQAKHFEQLYNEIRLDRRARFAVDDYCRYDFTFKHNVLSLVSDEFSIATRLQRYGIRNALSARHLLTDYSSAVMNEFLNFLTADRCRVFVSDFNWHGKHSGPCSFSLDKRLCCQFADAVSFSTEKLSENFLALCNTAWPTSCCKFDAEFDWPKPRPFICKDYSLKSRKGVDKQTIGPRLLSVSEGNKTSNVSLWYREDDRFQTQRAAICVELLLPDNLNTTLTSSIRLSILASLFSKKVADLVEQAADADHDLSVTRSNNGIQVLCCGHSEPLPMLMQTVLDRIAECRVTVNDFNEERVREAIANQPDFFVSQVAIAMQIFNYLNLAGFVLRKLHGYSWMDEKTREDQVIAVVYTTGLKPEIWSNPLAVNADILVLGNLTAKQAISIAKSTENTFSKKKTSQHRLMPFLLRCPERLLHKGGHHFFRLNVETNMDHLDGMTRLFFERVVTGTNSSCVMVLQVPNEASKKWSNEDELVNSEHFLHRLRHICSLKLLANAIKLSSKTSEIKLVTKFSYAANAMILELLSPLHPVKIEEKFESIIAHIGKKVSSLSKEIFVNLKNNVQRKVVMSQSGAAKHLLLQSLMYWQHITSCDYAFFWDGESFEKCSKTVFDDITKNDLVKYWKKWLKRGSPDRRVLSVHQINRKQFSIYEDDKMYSKYGGTEILNLDDFKANLQACPSAPRMPGEKNK